MSFTLAHLSDPHLAPLPPVRMGDLMNKRLTGYINWLRKRRFVHDPHVLERLMADLKAQGPNHIAVTGDIANLALAGEFTRGRDWLEKLGPPQDVSFVPGNHDIYVKEGESFSLHHWGRYMGGDDGRTGFPYVRRRGPLAIIGLSSGLPTAPFMATGKIGARQLAALGPLLEVQKMEGFFRVVLVHHPPVSQARPHRRLLDADLLRQALARHGAELLLHGHDHLAMLNRIDGPEGSPIPAVGVPSASAAPGRGAEAAAYNLYRIDGRANRWTCEMISRGISSNGNIVEVKRMTLDHLLDLSSPEPGRL
ncbi:MAG TPA: metallophosphoesterase [Pseudolabrys sp.]|nr:metallophosphoesterase [Pseudolabrys sp.]